jgi:hypothetical protein
MSKRYTVRGTDDDGDEHAFSTDDEQRARDMLNQMREDLEAVSMTEGTRAA